jgi:hypothetical protein
MRISSWYVKFEEGSGPPSKKMRRGIEQLAFGLAPKWRRDQDLPMHRALVAEALGVTGRGLVQHLTSLGDWEVIGLSRRKPEFQTDAARDRRVFQNGVCAAAAFPAGAIHVRQGSRLEPPCEEAQPAQLLLSGSRFMAVRRSNL